MQSIRLARSHVGLIVLLLAFQTCLLSESSADWGPNGVPVSPFGVLQDIPLIAKDGQGGAFVVWRDYRDHVTNDADVYLEHLTAAGLVSPGWPDDGLPLAREAGSQTAGWISHDGFGNAFVLWLDRVPTPYNLRLQKILADGTLAPGWPEAGFVLSTAPGSKQADLCPDGSGGTYATWHIDSPAAQVYLQHVLSDGSLAPGWPAEGRLLVADPAARCCPLIEADGSGGALVAWLDARGGDNRGWIKYVLRVQASGEPAEGWNPTGVPLFTQGRAVDIRQIATDGQGGAFVAWNDNRNGDGTFNPFVYDIYAQHVRGDGALDPAWPGEGIAVCNAPSGQYDFDMAADGLGGIVLLWEDFRNDFWQPFAQRILANGTTAPSWQPNGVLVSEQLTTQISPRLASDGMGGLFAFWVEFPTGNYEIYGQRLLANASRPPGWEPGGMLIASEPVGDCDDPSVASDGLGGAILAYERSTPTGTHVFAQRFESDLETPVLISLLEFETGTDRALLRWFAADANAVRATVERAENSNEAGWHTVGTAIVTAHDRLEFQDVGLAPGRYGYRLRYDDDGTARTTDVTWITIEETSRLSLSGFRPNPSPSAGARIWFSLPDTRAARLEVHDVNGRLVDSREVGEFGPGTHSVAVRTHQELAAGVYWFRLVREDRTLTSRGVVLP